MPTPATFITFSFLLRTTEGIGTAMFNTASYKLLTHLYPDKKGTIVVSLHKVHITTSHKKEKSDQFITKVYALYFARRSTIVSYIEPDNTASTCNMQGHSNET